MPCAMTLLLDDQAAARITRLTDALDRAGLAGPGARNGGPPHVTLGVYPDTAEVDALHATAAILGQSWRPLPVRFASLGVFPGTPGVLFVAPVVTSALLVRHAQLLARHRGDGHFASGAWVPHVTLLQDLEGSDAAARALAVAAAAWEPFTATLDRLALFRFPPAVVVEVVRLG